MKNVIDRHEKNQGMIAVRDGWEYWQFGADVFRVAVGNRGYILPEGIPANARWECTVEHFRNR